MEYRPLGRTGVQVSKLCLGCMNFGDGALEDDSLAMVRAAVEAGINFLDTADVYGRGASERIVGRALAELGCRDRIVLATKVHHRMDDADPNGWGSARQRIIRGCEESLRRLRTDHIDLYQLHRPHPAVPIDESLRALDDLVRQGKVRYIGTSTFAAWQVVEGLWASRDLGLNRFVSEQPPYNLLDRRVERELLPMCRTYDIAVLPWAPIAGGLLSGKYREGSPRPEDSRFPGGTDYFNRDNDTALSRVEEYVRYCEGRSISPLRLALAWVAERPGVTSPIVGPRSMAHLNEYVAVIDYVVTDDDRAAIDRIFPPQSHVSRYYEGNFGPNARWS